MFVQPEKMEEQKGQPHHPLRRSLELRGTLWLGQKVWRGRKASLSISYEGGSKQLAKLGREVGAHSLS